MMSITDVEKMLRARLMTFGGITSVGVEATTNLSLRLASHPLQDVTVLTVMPANEVLGMCLIYVLFGMAGALGGLLVSLLIKPLLIKWAAKIIKNKNKSNETK